MKNRMLVLLLSALLPIVMQADHFINLTPKPRAMSVEEGSLQLPKKFGISVAGLSEEMAAEAELFATAFNAATGYEAFVTTDTQTLFHVATAETTLGDEGYKLDVTADGVQLEAQTPAGLYFGFQTIKKLLPPNVMAGVKDPSVSEYILPFVKITDSPRFGYRGFMLDVSRHFFTVDEVKRVIDVMSYYKMNRFHWHLTDDHGWRVEIKKYPKLTTVGAISDNSYVVDMKYGDYWLNRPYGPYFYTQDQLRDVVAYAKSKHIEIIPEIDMPGHFCAAMAAYPEFSCTPDGAHSVVTNIGGVYNDVLNVANPKAVQFAKDVLEELMDIFPYEFIHIGGDECPTTAWENNAECIARKKDLGLDNFRQLQSYFIKDIAEFASEHERKLIVWNEAITAGGADTKTIQETGATVMCWVGADNAVAKSASLRLDHIYTPQVPWYINRKQSTDPSEPKGAGQGTDNLEAVYNQNIPVPSGTNAKYFKGVQATFWCEYVAFRDYLEYLMLPRLVAVAEAGWTPQAKRNFNDFRRRVTADSTLFNYNGYNYGRHYMKESGSSAEKVLPEVSVGDKKFWYRMVTRATDTRAGRCIELLSEGSSLIGEYAGKQAQSGRLWTSEMVEKGEAAYDYQFWAIEEDPENPGRYALVCKASPDGSVNPVPTANGTSGRWDYDYDSKHFNFLLADNGYGKDGENYYYSLRSDQVEGLWMNASLGGQGFAVNLYGTPSDGNGGLWSFVPMEAVQGTDELLDLMNEARAYLSGVKTYHDDSAKVPGLFGEKETAELRHLMSQDYMSMTASQLAEFTEQLRAAYAAFRLSFGYMEKGRTYWFGNNVEPFLQQGLFDDGTTDKLKYTDEFWADDAWEVTDSQIHDDYSQTVKLCHSQTGRFISSVAGSATGRIGFPVSLGNKGVDMLCTFDAATKDYTLSISGKNLFPISEGSLTNPGTVSSGSTTGTGNAIRPMGAAWDIRLVEVRMCDCYDTEGHHLGLFRHSFGKYAEYNDSDLYPEIKNHLFLEEKDGKFIYQRTAYSVTTICRDRYGAIISETESACPLGETMTVVLPELPYYQFEESDHSHGEALTPQTDVVINAVYSTDAYNGVRCLGRPVTSLEAGRSYVIYDTSPNAPERIGYRNVNVHLQVMKNNSIDGTDPLHVWTLEGSGNKTFKVKNEYYGLYVPKMTTAPNAVTLSEQGDKFTFTLNSDGETWKIKGSNGVCWDGLGSGALVGWNDPGHPYRLYEYYVQPYFEVLVKAVTDSGELLGQTRTLVKAGDSYTILADTYEGYVLRDMEGHERLGSVDAHTEVTLVYEPDIPSGIDKIESSKEREGIYDLSGRRLKKVHKQGIYIVNGKKILVR